MSSRKYREMKKRSCRNLGEEEESDREPELSEASSVGTGLKLCAATLRHMRDPRQILLIPLTMFSGLEQAFFSSDFTAVCGQENCLLRRKLDNNSRLIDFRALR